VYKAAKRHQHFINCEELTKTVGGLAIFDKFIENKPADSQLFSGHDVDHPPPSSAEVMKR
jgi:hypothetical protein